MPLWRPVPGFPYEVSDHGQVRNASGKLLKPEVMSYGYRRVDLHGPNGAYRREYVHRLVLLAFIGPCPEGMEALHGPNHDKADNRLCNLRWGTHQENISERVHAKGNQYTRRKLQLQQAA